MLFNHRKCLFNLKIDITTCKHIMWPPIIASQKINYSPVLLSQRILPEVIVEDNNIAEFTLGKQIYTKLGYLLSEIHFTVLKRLI